MDGGEVSSGDPVVPAMGLASMASAPIIAAKPDAVGPRARDWREAAGTRGLAVPPKSILGTLVAAPRLSPPARPHAIQLINEVLQPRVLLYN